MSDYSIKLPEFAKGIDQTKEHIVKTRVGGRDWEHIKSLDITNNKQGTKNLRELIKLGKEKIYEYPDQVIELSQSLQKIADLKQKELASHTSNLGNKILNGVGKFVPTDLKEKLLTKDESYSEMESHIQQIKEFNKSVDEYKKEIREGEKKQSYDMEQEKGYYRDVKNDDVKIVDKLPTDHQKEVQLSTKDKTVIQQRSDQRIQLKDKYPTLDEEQIDELLEQLDPGDSIEDLDITLEFEEEEVEPERKAPESQKEIP